MLHRGHHENITPRILTSSVTELHTHMTLSAAFNAAAGRLGWALASSMTLGGMAWLGWSPIAIAASPDTAPDELLTLIDTIEAAANRQNVRAAMAFYDRNIEHSDGLSHSDIERALTQFWFNYPEANYETTLLNWEPTDTGFIAETETVITGSQLVNRRRVALTARVVSRQTYENSQIVAQTVISESTQLNSGANPPTLDINLPNQVVQGESFNFDAIVQEPLGDRVLLGSAIEEQVDADRYFDTTPLDLEVLIAGGLFKVGQVMDPGHDRWISAVIVREDGLTTVTQRVFVDDGVTEDAVSSFEPGWSLLPTDPSAGTRANQSHSTPTTQRQ